MIQKLKSNKGASLSFALLLFLVCAVVGGVVLAAGTAAAGRLSEIAEMDQRYYAVTSAAELLKTELDQKTVTVKRFRTIIETEVNRGTEEEPNWETVVSYGYGITPQITTSTGTNLSKGTSILGDAAIDMVFGGVDVTSATDEAAWKRAVGLADAALDWKKTVSLSVNGADYSGLKTKTEFTMDTNGKITVTISNDEVGGKEIYSLRMILTPSVSDTGTGDSVSTRITTITWKASGIEKVTE